MYLYPHSADNRLYFTSIDYDLTGQVANCTNLGKHPDNCTAWNVRASPPEVAVTQISIVDIGHQNHCSGDGQVSIETQVPAKLCTYNRVWTYEREKFFVAEWDIWSYDSQGYPYYSAYFDKPDFVRYYLYVLSADDATDTVRWAIGKVVRSSDSYVAYCDGTYTHDDNNPAKYGQSITSCSEWYFNNSHSWQVTCLCTCC